MADPFYAHHSDCHASNRRYTRYSGSLEHIALQEFNHPVVEQKAYPVELATLAHHSPKQSEYQQREYSTK